MTILSSPQRSSYVQLLAYCPISQIQKKTVSKTSAAILNKTVLSGYQVLYFQKHRQYPASTVNSHIFPSACNIFDEWLRTFLSIIRLLKDIISSWTIQNILSTPMLMALPSTAINHYPV